jgi:hypothetical protein
MKADVATFKKSVSKMNKLMDEHKIQMDQVVMKKQYVDICTMANKSETLWLSLKKLGMIERWRSLAEKDNWAPKSSS